MSREAMKLALEALKNFEKAGLATLKTIDAITAIKQALEQAEPEPVAWANLNALSEQINSVNCGTVYRLPSEVEGRQPLYTFPPKREPEPVIDKSAAIRIATSLGWTPKRKPLTDEQVRECSQAMDAEPLAEGWTELIKFARAIEAAHGIKGEA